MPRTLGELPAVPDAPFVAALRAALDGRGPALLPLPLDAAAASRVRAAARPEEPVDDAVALVVPTSGSTGLPKGVELTAEALRVSAAATLEVLERPDGWVLALPVTHVAGIQVLVRSLVAGTEPLLADDLRTVRLPAGRWCTALVPTQLRRLLAEAPEALAAYDAVLLGGAAAPPALLAEARARGVRVVTTYGMSETSGGCVYDGVPLPGVRVALADDGRVRLGGPVLARGYRGAPPFAGGWFTTSDLGRLEGDRLVVLGRADDVVVTGGEKVVPGEVEQVLAGHPAVADVAVVGVPDAEWGARVVAVAVLRAPLTLEQARAHVAERLGRVAAPRELRVVDALPLLPSGKPDRVALRDRD